ncbi:MAG: PEP-CTERM sorting domain-containing protein [Pirellulales bacterium]|nr:PEP-CTERM sorting domain-containing protein [Pirellulales bacterium]
MTRTVEVGLLLMATLVCVGVKNAAAAPLAGVSVASGTPIGFNAAAGLGALTDGVVDDDDWLTAPWTSMGWLDAGWNLNPAISVDTAVSQPQLTFDLGGTYAVNSVTVHYVIDHIAGDDTRNLRAPDMMTATFSAAGVGGPFGSAVVESGWDDSDAGDGTAGGVGDARSLTTSLGGAIASAVQLDFRTNGEWLFISEISFDGSLVPEPATLGSLALGCMLAGASSRRRLQGRR